jgi:DNA primase
MGTALTAEQVSELARMANTVVLALDSDAAGQDAMLRAARVAAGRRLELRVVPLPEGTDPAELVEREGADALRQRVEASTPFVVFHVERILERADTRSAEGRDRAVEELRPVLADVPASVLREDLLRRVAGRLELSEGRLAALVASAAAPSGGSDVRIVRAPPLDQGVRAERTFLGLCVALPEAGNAVLAAIDPDELLTSEPLRRAARHLTGRTSSPLARLPANDDELSRIVSDLVARAGRAENVSAEQLEHARLVLERARLERAIRRARAEGRPGIGELAREREGVLEGIRRVVARLEQAV